MNENSDPVEVDEELAAPSSEAAPATDAVPEATVAPSDDTFPIAAIGASAGGLVAAPATDAVPEATIPPSDDTFPIVGIGASAGGLEALEQFLKGVPQKSGMAFVIVQHLDPTQPGMLPELLQRVTSMPVIPIKDTQSIEPNCVYVIPSGQNLSLLHRVLHLLKPEAPRGLRLPIDIFFRSLADDLQENSIGVILSGMGSDGTIGLRAIKEKGGLVLVQDPTSAKFDGMPRSAIDTKLADIVAPADDLAKRILAYVRHEPIVSVESEPQVEPTAENTFDKVKNLLRSHTGHDFSQYKKSTVSRRIERRMAIHQFDQIPDYVRFLQENPPEIDLLFRELLIGVTSFFRDSAVWEALKNQVIPDLIAAVPEGTTLRAWVAACSTGEEAFSLAIVFQEALGKVSPAKQCTLQIYATDLDKDAIGRARAGYYPENIATEVSGERLSRFFVKEEKRYRVGKEIREMVIFAPQNVIMDPPFTRLDLLSCRNLLIYLEQEIQRKLIPLFHYSLNPGGVLILGLAESIGNFRDLFSAIDSKLRIYQRVQTSLSASPIEFPTAFFPPPDGKADPRPSQTPVVNLQSLADQVILQQYAPAAVLTSDAGDILYIKGRTGRFLEPAAGKANWNVFAMARDGLRTEMGGAFRRVIQQDEPVTLSGVRIDVDGGTVYANVTIQKLVHPTPLKGLMLIIFADVPPPPPNKVPKGDRRTVRSAEVRELEERLRRGEQEMQSTNEELQLANEELQSTNEELQSTNEELTTSKEEMQSLNEELQTVNAELVSRLSDLSHVNDDMKNLLNSTNIATIFLDERLNLRWYTIGMTKLVNLLPGDVGRPVTDIASDLFYSDLIRDAGQVLQTLVPVETEVGVKDGHWFSVRITPYRTLENMIAGVVITFTNITAFRDLERDISEARLYAEAIVATIRDPLLVLDSAMHVVSANRSFFKKFRVSPEDITGRELYTLGDGEWDIPELRRLLETVLPKSTVFNDVQVDHVFSTIGRRVMLLNARRIITEGANKELILLAFEDVTGSADKP